MVVNAQFIAISTAAIPFAVALLSKEKLAPKWKAAIAVALSFAAAFFNALHVGDVWTWSLLTNTVIAAAASGGFYESVVTHLNLASNLLPNLGIGPSSTPAAPAPVDPPAAPPV